MTTYDLESIRARVASIRAVAESHPDLKVGEDVEVIAFLIGEIDEAQANIEAAREHLQSVVSNQRYVGTRVQEEAAHAIGLLDGEPDGAEA